MACSRRRSRWCAPRLMPDVSRINTTKNKSIQIEYGDTMRDDITVSGEQATQIFKALNGIGELLKALPSKPENAAVMYAIMSNVAIIQSNLTGMPRVSSN